jgi:hypothetical protein
MPIVNTPYTRCRVGVAMTDVTPPVGIYARTWGAADHDAAEGVHRPFSATAAAIAPLNGEGPTLVLVALDIGWFQYVASERGVRQTAAQRASLDEANLIINLSHTHAGPNVNPQLANLPGGHLIAPYMEELTEKVADVVVAALADLAPAWITYGYGKCGLATNRDFWDAEAGRYACGFNPERKADDTLLVARITGDDGAARATLFNYACHPTTLAWDNKLLSPDFIGAAREVLERDFGAPALFLQGALGDVAPRDDYVGDTAVADRNGRQLGYAAAAALEALPPPGTKFVYTGIRRSGADLGTWEHQPADADDLAGTQSLAAQVIDIPLARRVYPPLAEMQAQLEAETDRREQEIIRRKMFIFQTLGEGTVHHMPVWIWRLGQAALVGIPNEPYSVLQEELRARFPGKALIIMGVSNGTLGYLCPRDTYGRGIYQEIQSPYQPGCLEQTIEAISEMLEQIL